MSRPDRRIWHAEEAQRSRIGEMRARDQRWLAGGKSKVVHPTLGSVVVPHISKYGALLCAAEFFGVPAWPFVREAECVNATDEDGPVRRPREYYRVSPSSSPPGHLPPLGEGQKGKESE